MYRETSTFEDITGTVQGHYRDSTVDSTFDTLYSIPPISTLVSVISWISHIQSGVRGFISDTTGTLATPCTRKGTIVNCAGAVGRVIGRPARVTSQAPLDVAQSVDEYGDN